MAPRLAGPLQSMCSSQCVLATHQQCHSRKRRYDMEGDRPANLSWDSHGIFIKKIVGSLSLSLYRNCAVAELSSYSQGSVGTFAAQCPALQLNCTVDLLPIMVRLKLPYAIHLQDPLPPLVATESIASSLFKHLKSGGDSCANISCNPRFATFYTDDIHSRVVNQLTKGMEENYRQMNLFKLPSH